MKFTKSILYTAIIGLSVPMFSQALDMPAIATTVGKKTLAFVGDNWKILGALSVLSYLGYKAFREIVLLNDQAMKNKLRFFVNKDIKLLKRLSEINDVGMFVDNGINQMIGYDNELERIKDFHQRYTQHIRPSIFEAKFYNSAEVKKFFGALKSIEDELEKVSPNYKTMRESAKLALWYLQ